MAMFQSITGFLRREGSETATLVTNSDFRPTLAAALDPGPTTTARYYEHLCEIQPQARINYAVSTLTLYRRSDSEQEEEFVVARVKHGRYDLADVYLLIEGTPYSSDSLSDTESSPVIIKGMDVVCVHTINPIEQQSYPPQFQVMQRVSFNTPSSVSDVRKLCIVVELFRLISIISGKSNLYSIKRDMSYWFAETIMETAKAIFPSNITFHSHYSTSELDEKFKLRKPESECGRAIVAAYKTDRKKYPIPGPQRVQEMPNQAVQLEQEKSAREEAERQLKEERRLREEAERGLKEADEEIQKLHKKLNKLLM